MGLVNEQPDAYDPVREMLAENGIAPEQEDNNPEADEQEYQNNVEEDDSDDSDDLEDENEDESEPDDEDENPAPQDNLIDIDGEQVSLEELKKGHLRQSDYTRKMQELSDQRTSLAALEGLGRVLATDPQKAAQIAAILQGKGQSQPDEPVNKKPVFDDPVDEMEWEVTQKVLSKLAPHLQQVQQKNDMTSRAIEIQQALAPFQRDPEFGSARAELDAMVADVVAKEGLAAGNKYYQRLDSDPSFFGEEFAKAKVRLKSKVENSKVIPKKKGTPKLIGADASGRQEPSQNKKTRTAEQAALASGDPDALFNVLKSGGRFGNLYGDK